MKAFSALEYIQIQYQVHLYVKAVRNMYLSLKDGTKKFFFYIQITLKQQAKRSQKVRQKITPKGQIV